MLNTVNRATNSITADNDTYEIVGFLWVQGEADANRNYGSLYNANLTNFISEVRSEFGADMPFFISFLSDNQVYGANADDDLVRQAQLDVAAADDNTFLLDTNGPEFVINPAPDNLHYTSVGQVVLGAALADTFLAATSTEPPVDTPTEGIIVQEDFDGAETDSLDGTSPTIGTGTWLAASGFSANGSSVITSNSSASLPIGNVINNAAGSADGLFELTATLTQPTSVSGVAANNWYSIGFSQDTAPASTSHFLDRNGIGSIILRSRGDLDMWAGNGFTPNGLNPSGNSNNFNGPDATDGARTITIEMHVRDANGTTNFGTVTYFDSQIEDPLFTFTYTNELSSAGIAATQPLFNSIMLSSNAAGSGTSGVYSNLTLTQMVTASPPLLGDVNLDTVVNFSDISPFIAVLSAQTFQEEADINGDDVVDFSDISPFIAVLSGG